MFHHFRKLIGAAVISAVLGGLASSRGAEECAGLCPESVLVSLYRGCVEAGGSHVDDAFDKVLDEVKRCIACIYDRKMHEHGGINDWKFEDPFIHKLYEEARENVSWMYKDASRYPEDKKKKEFVNFFVYAMAEELMHEFDADVYESPVVDVDWVELRLQGNEKSAALVYHRDTGKTTVSYERDENMPAQPERVVMIESLHGHIPQGATPYFQLPKDADIVSCWVQQTGDHMFLWQVQNVYHCCAHTVVEAKDGTRRDYKFWRDGQEMQSSSDKLLPEQDASKFLKVFFSVQE